jgi:putative membrane protein
MNKLLATSAVALLIAAAPAFAQTTTGGARNSGTGTTMDRAAPSDTATSRSDRHADKLSRGDEKFVKKAAHDNQAEIELGQLAQQKAANPRVKQFAEQLVKDHQDANQQLMSWAQGRNVDLSDKGKDKAVQKEHDKLAKLSGGEFDRQFMDRMVKDHKDDVSAFEKESKKADDPQVKQFAATILPKLQQHLQMAQDIQKEVKATQTSRNDRSTDRAARTGGTTGSTVPPAGATVPSGRTQ